MHSRKRSSVWLDKDDSISVSLAYTPINLAELPSKRLQNNQGAPVTNTKPLVKYDVQRLLSNLAFTRFYVTANFQNFNPTTSSTVLCMASEQNDLYQALCQILPSLYQLSPSLQALAVTCGYINPNSQPDQALQQILPLHTTACVDAIVVEDFERFQREVTSELVVEGAIAVVGPDGTCVWNSVEAFPNAVVSSEGLLRALAGVLSAGAGGDVVMSGG